LGLMALLAAKPARVSSHRNHVTRQGGVVSTPELAVSVARSLGSSKSGSSRRPWPLDAQDGSSCFVHGARFLPRGRFVWTYVLRIVPRSPHCRMGQAGLLRVEAQKGARWFRIQASSWYPCLERPREAPLGMAIPIYSKEPPGRKWGSWGSKGLLPRLDLGVSTQGDAST
jgi:hypothetical protein